METKTKTQLFDWGFIALTVFAYWSIPTGIGQRKLSKLYELILLHPELKEELAPFKSYAYQLQHNNIAPYAAIAALSLWYAYTKPTSKAIRVVLILIAIYMVPLNYLVQTLS
ncbi:hypothetical protein ACLVWU_08470 [Bdellovibrio sp. HCB290]|uniref:hypothetical protein n=1 Tax=Bdellovibrio sp. HCB290 TaxID=3394356 RepID=UPI0039B627F7